MRKFTIIIIFALTGLLANAQPTGYYNGTAGKKGDDLKAALHEIINDHVNYSYSQAKYLINYSDADPSNPDNVILFYTQRSSNADNYGTGGDKINREHVWAKSHGDFSGIRPMDGDAFNLRPADASVNVDRSNFDFGIVQPGGTQHSEATTCWYDATARVWEPGPATKGQVARILLYMSTRYEGTGGEMDLEAVEGYNTYPKAEHGDLEALLQWHRDYPPTDFERRRVHRIYAKQRNRNPFVDHPEFVDMIWGDAEAKAIKFDECSRSPLFPKKNESTTISIKVEAPEALTSVKLFWGDSYNSEDNEVVMTASGAIYSGAMSIEDFNDDDVVYYKVVAATASDENTWHESYILPRDVKVDDLTSIPDVQGTGIASTIKDQKVTIAGRIVANMDNSIYIQSGTGDYCGLSIFAPNTVGYIGDSIVIKGTVDVYNNLSQLSSVEYAYNFGDNKKYEPIQITANQIGERYEGMLVKIKNVTLSDGGALVSDGNNSYNFSDGTGSSTIYSKYDSRLIGKKLPEGLTDLVGIVSQYKDTYQLLPRDINDFMVGNDTIPPSLISLEVTSREWLRMIFNEAVEESSAKDTSNYSFNNNIKAIDTYYYSHGKTVLLKVTGLTTGTHTLTLNGVEDRLGNAMNNASMSFEADFTSVKDLSKKTIEVYPNPVSGGVLNINSDDRIFSASIYSFSGKQIFSKVINDYSDQITLDAPGGFYLLNLVTEKGIKVEKIIVP